MDENAWGFIGVTLAAAIGGTGLVGVLTGGIELSRRARLSRSIEKTRGLIALLGENASESAALRHAVRVDALRLASLSLIQLPTAIRRVFGLLLGVLIVAGLLIVVALGPERLAVVLSMDQDAPIGRSIGSSFWIALIATVAYVGALVWLADAQVRRRRAAYVSAVDAGLNPLVASQSFSFAHRELEGALVLGARRRRAALSATSAVLALNASTAPKTLRPRLFRKGKRT